MTTMIEKGIVTPEELLAMPDAVNYELVNGQLVERSMGTLSSWIGGEIHGQLRNFVREHSLGWVFPADQGYQCFADDPMKVRKPDASFVAAARLSAEQMPEGYLSIAPDLAVEVLSPNERALEVEWKVREYLTAGVRLVWIVNPETRMVRVHRADRTVAEAQETEELDGEDVVLGFRTPVQSLFPAKTPARQRTQVDQLASTSSDC
ncbi:MAG: Uma2 family endonuclease [Pirellulales bacterium]|nr:Uma2 family endonuclease [Pirellulales bacterium]